MAIVLLCWFLLLPGFVAAQAPSAPPIPLEHFTRDDEFGAVKISPDGEFLAAARRVDGRSMLVFLSLKEQKAVSGIQAPDGIEIAEFHWISPTRLIYFIKQWRSNAEDAPLTGEIYAVDRDGGNQTILYGQRAGDCAAAICRAGAARRIKSQESTLADAALISSLPDDPQNILIAEYDGRVRGLRWYLDADAPTEIALLDVYTGEKSSLGVVPLNGARVLVDGDEQVRFAVGLDVRRRLAVVWKPQAYSSWTAFELKGFRKGSVLPRLFSADGRSVYFTGVAEGQSVSSLFRFDLESHDVEQIYSFGNVDVDGLVTDVTGREIVGLTAYANRAVYHWLATDHPSAKLYAAFQRAFPDQEIAVTSTTSDGRLSVVFVSSDVNPGEYHLFDRVTGSIRFMRAIRPWMDSRSMRPKQPIQLTARDGMKLHGYVTRPPSGGRHPLIVLPHGGPDGTRDRWNFDWVVQLFASRGYAVLQVNFRGSGGYGMDFEAAGFRQWGGAIQDDITDATRWAIDQGIADADRICIFGSGFGGHAALMGVVREPDLYRCAVGYSGIYDLRLLSEEAPRFGSRRSYLETVRSEDPADTRNRSPVHHAARITVPVLLIHGEDDWSADFDHSKRLRRAMERHEKSVEWISLGREGHGIYDENTRRDVYERILGFLERNLTPTAAVAEQGQSEAR